MRTNSIPANLSVHARITSTQRHLIVCRASRWTGLLAFASIAFGARPTQAAVTEAWVQRYDGPANASDLPTAVAVDSSGNVVVTGNSYNGANSDYYTAKYAAASGALLWEKRFNGSANSGDGANAVAVDGSGNVVVTGYAVGPLADADYYTVKYAAADGALLWEQRYNGPANGLDEANAVVVDGSGNVVVTGASDSHFHTAKYAAMDGALLWERHGPRRAPILHSPPNVAVDGSGNIVVTGSSFKGTNPDDYSNPDYYTAKYAAADGAVLWEKRYNGPANADDYARAVAVDSNGSVLVTGTSWTWLGSDYYTAKYAAADGALLWEKRYDNSDAYAHAVAVDGSGNVVVTGTSGLEYYTAKYAAADGALLWEKRFAGPAQVGDSPYSLALGADGMVAVTGTVNGGYTTVVYRDVPAVSIDLVPTGVRLRFSGISGRTYNIERAPALAGSWSIINTQAAPGSGLFEYLDTHLPASAAFYRMSEP